MRKAALVLIVQVALVVLVARAAQIPLGRMGQPEDAAQMAVYLASEESSWVTGAAIPLDGGLSAY
jgi:NAD(P)-dependent dehydrogenase (short-subunit alcohol dehydrogenase family)